MSEKQKTECLYFEIDKDCKNVQKCRFAKDGQCTVNGNLTGQSIRTLNTDSQKKEPLYRTLANLLIVLTLMSCQSTEPIKSPSYVSSDPIWLDMIPEPYRSTCIEISETHGFSFKTIFSLVEIESGWNKWAVGKNNNGTFDRGLCQLNSGNNWNIDYYDPVQNLKAGFKYLAQMVKKFGNLETGLIAYNAGPGRVMRGTFPESSKLYARRILGS